MKISFERQIIVGGIVLTMTMISITTLAQTSFTPAVPESAWVRRFWLDCFDTKRALAATGRYDVVFMGDSITHNWENGGIGGQVWAANYATGPYRALNCGFSGDCLASKVLCRG